MAGRFTRFLKLERPHQRGEQQTPVANASRFAPEEPRAPGSGIAIDEEPDDAQPFLRCARCEMDSTRFAQACANCGAALHTPEQELYNRRLWQKRRAEAAAEREAVEKMHQAPPTAQAQEEEARLAWMAGGMNVPFGIRALAAMSPRWRWRTGIAVALWLSGTGLTALSGHHPTAMWLFFGTLAVLLALFTPAQPRWRRRYWWSSGWW